MVRLLVAGCWLLILILVLMLLLLQNMNNGFACSCRSTSVHCMNYIMKTNFKRNLWCSNFVASVFISLLFAMYTLRETCSFMSVRVEWQAYSSQFTAGKKPYSSNEFVWFCCQAFVTAAAALAAVVAVFLCSLLVYSLIFGVMIQYTMVVLAENEFRLRWVWAKLCTHGFQALASKMDFSLWKICEREIEVSTTDRKICAQTKKTFN